MREVTNTEPRRWRAEFWRTRQRKGRAPRPLYGVVDQYGTWYLFPATGDVWKKPNRALAVEKARELNERVRKEMAAGAA